MGKMAPSLPAELRTVYRMLKMAEATWGALPALHQPIGQGKYRTYNWVEYARIAEEVAAGLHALGIRHGDIVGLASETRAEFYLADIGVMTNGSIAAAVYTSLPPADQVKTLKGCDPRLVFLENAKTMQVLDEAGLSDLRMPRILLDGGGPGALSLDQLRAMGRTAMDADPGLLTRLVEAVQPRDYAILYLTSGATGEPKMGLVTHHSIVSNCECGPPVLPVSEDDRTIAFLPSAHITQRMVMQQLMIRMGVPVHFSEGLNKLPAELRAIRPTFFVAPPRVWERMYASITTEIRKRPAVIRKLFYLGLGVGSEAARARREGRQPAPWVGSSLKFFDKVVFSKIRTRLGGAMRIAASGSAPLGKDLAEFYASIGMPLIEGYGLTEGGVVALNPIDRPRAGSIGKVLPGAEIRFDTDGELLIRGAMVFSGYYKDPDATAAVLRDGWLHTGDIGEMDSDGYIWITGRKKELIVASNGKKIYPARIEGLFKLEPLVNQVLLVGDRLPYVTAVITINQPAAESLAGVKSGSALSEVSQSPAVQEEVKRIVQRVNRQLAPFEQIRKFKILEREFSIEAGELTPTMKLRRGKVIDNLRGEIGALYVGRDSVD
ncbi:long-chain fatty acid--CoA ligase [uncultured Paludibaculum sp.]|uniref:AMP-dependent synthetase/ligase n=1 Tax=uncultured Paludibaculum sp. TaxID=1765020 RepID=UPI002AAAB471|nr:long-chain fatty acid--CoA ligase [uncultured Paludibaculum sp.]